MSEAQDDVVWVDVVPAMEKFFPALAKGTQEASGKAGKESGKSFSAGFNSTVKKAGAGAAVVGAGAFAVSKQLYNLGSVFDDVSDTIRVGTGATGDALDGLVGSAQNVATKVPSSFEDISSAVADVNTRLGMTGPQLETVSSQFLQLGNITGEKIDIQGLTSSLKGFGVENEDVSKSLDHLYQVSQASGVGINELSSRMQTNAPVIKELGLSYNEAATLVGSLDKAGVNSQAVMGAMAKSMSKLAKTGEDPAKAFSRVTGEIQGFIKKGDDAKAMDLAGKVFGTRGAPQLISALKSGALSFEDLNKMAGQTEDTILGAGEDTADFAEQWQLFKNQMMVAVAPAAEYVFGVVGDGMAYINDVAVPAVKQFTDEWEKGVGTGGRYRDMATDIYGKIKEGTGFVSDHRNAFALLGGVILSGVAAYKAYQVGAAAAHGVMKAYDLTMKVVKGTQAAYNAVVRLGTAAQLGQKAAWIGSKIVMLGHAAVTGIMTAAQWALNAALTMNPIGLVVVALAALAIAFVVAYKKSDTFRRIVNGAWDGIQKAGNAAWTWLRDKVFSPLGHWFGTVLPEKLGQFGDKFGTVWAGLKSAAATPINFVIGTVYNNGLRKALNLIPGVDLAEASLIKMAKGGTVERGIAASSNRPVLWGEVPNVEEYYIPINGSNRSRQLLSAAASKLGMVTMANGGYIWPTTSRAMSGNYSGHSGVDIPVRTGTPVYATEDGRVDYTGTGRGYGIASFLAGNDGVRWVYGHLSRIIAAAGAQVAKGQLLGYSGNTGRSTGPHLHIEAARGAFAQAGNRAYTLGLLDGSMSPSGDGGGLDLLTKLPELFKGVLGSVGKLSDFGPWGTLLQSPMSSMMNTAKTWGMDKIKSMFSGALDTVTSAAGSVIKTPAVALGKNYAAERGWTGSEWDALYSLWQKESGWNPFAKNPSSGAYGIPQSLPGNKMASAGWDWRVNPATQIKWGLQYIAERYGRPSAAWAHSQQTNWYNMGTNSARSGMATLSEYGMPELVIGRQNRMMTGGETVYSSAATRRLFGGGSSEMAMSGTMTIDEDGVAFIRGIAEQVFEDMAA